MRLRIVAGSLGGRFIEAPPGRRTRPTAERVREAWFAALGGDVADARLLDLFAGSGALGIEALSRGARHVHFVEADRRTVAVLRRNLEGLGVEERATVVCRDALRFVRAEDERWGVALADPPYGAGLAERLVALYRKRSFADCLWVEHAADRPPAAGAEWSRRYGDSAVSRYCLPPAPSAKERTA